MSPLLYLHCMPNTRAEEVLGGLGNQNPSPALTHLKMFREKVATTLAASRWVNKLRERRDLMKVPQ